jgi:2Fe-2S ferredoxin
MSSVTYVAPTGVQHTIEVPDGDSVMRGALNNMIDGIVGECGGGLACATCHAYVDDAWIGRVGPPSEIEGEMLDSAACARKPGSRLCCQITVRPELDGLVVHLPEKQF